MTGNARTDIKHVASITEELNITGVTVLLQNYEELMENNIFCENQEVNNFIDD